MDSPWIIVLVTAKDSGQAGDIGRRLLQDKLIACVNIVPAVHSLFWWQGKIDESHEALMVIKSRKELFPRIVQTVRELHSYQVPEILALPILDGNQDYLDWVDESLGQGKGRDVQDDGVRNS